MKVIALAIAGCIAFVGLLALFSGESLLTVAVTTKNPLFVRAVLPFVEPDEVGEGQFPAIVVAAHSGHVAITGILLDSEINPNLQGPDGRTALVVATLKGHDFIARKLIASGGNPNIRDSLGRTPLSYAAELGRDKMVKDFIHNEADLNLGDANNNVPLYYSITTGNHGITRDLVEMKAAVNSLNDNGQTPLQAAWTMWINEKRISPNLERIAISYLLENGLDPSIEDKSGKSLKSELTGTEYEPLLPVALAIQD